MARASPATVLFRIILKRAVKEDENGVAVQKHNGF
jgi:hypothetical protein